MSDRATPDQNSPADPSAQRESPNSERPNAERPGRKLLLDLGPLVVFFAANYVTGDFMLAVKVLVGTTVVALAAGWYMPCAHGSAYPSVASK